MELTSEILFLEVIYRILVCIFEAFCLSSSVGRTGGATPGKALLGIRIVTASAVIPVEGRPRETVLLYPGRTLSFTVALVRSLMKNFLISLLFPLCVVLFVFRHNRTGYDLLCGVIVVEENMFPPRRHAPWVMCATCIQNVCDYYNNRVVVFTRWLRLLPNLLVGFFSNLKQEPLVKTLYLYPTN